MVKQIGGDDLNEKIVIVGTLDTKGEEFQFIKDIFIKEGLQTVVIDTGVKGEPYFSPDISSDKVAKSGGSSIHKLISNNDRGQAIDVMMKGAAKIVQQINENERIKGIISLGGTAGTTIGTYAMRTLPIGIPKIMVSTVASGDTKPYVGEKDIIMINSVVDISGINSFSAIILANAAYALVGMAKGNYQVQMEEKPLLAATMFGVTTPCVTKAREHLEKNGYEVLVFHATGSGGKAMESLIDSGFIQGVLDITTTELCDELVGGVLSAGKDRLEAAGKNGIPQVVSTGALDMVNFGAIDTVPSKFKDRKLYKHNPTVTLMRTTKEENEQLGKMIADKLNAANGSTALFLPLKGVSMIDVEGQPFYGPEEDQVLFDTLKRHIDEQKVEVIEMNTDLNDDAFAIALAEKLIEMMKGDKLK